MTLPPQVRADTGPGDAPEHPVRVLTDALVDDHFEREFYA